MPKPDTERRKQEQHQGCSRKRRNRRYRSPSPGPGAPRDTGRRHTLEAEVGRRARCESSIENYRSGVRVRRQVGERSRWPRVVARIDARHLRRRAIAAADKGKGADAVTFETEDTIARQRQTSDTTRAVIDYTDERVFRTLVGSRIVYNRAHREVRINGENHIAASTGRIGGMREGDGAGSCRANCPGGGHA